MAIEWKKNDLPTLAQKVADDASETCQNFIYAGIDVELSGGTQHFSLMPNDQTNIDSMFAAITLGASEYPYHPDGGKCVMYSAADIITLYSEYKSFVTKQTTYCNALRQWAKRETDPNVIGSIYYGCTLPEDLEKEVEGILSAAQAQIVAIINKLSASGGPKWQGTLYVKLPSSLCSEDLHTSDSRCFSEDIAIGRCSPSADSFF